MHRTTDYLRRLLDAGVSEESLELAIGQCLDEAEQGQSTFSRLALSGLFRAILLQIADRPLSIQKANAIQELLRPLLEDVLKLTGDPPAQVCKTIELHQEEIIKLLRGSWSGHAP